VISDLAAVYGKRQGSAIDVVCTTCRTIDSVSLFNFERCWRCKTCEPLGSKQQLEILEFVESLGFTDAESSTRKIIPPLEIDVWVPSMKVGIEHHGLYWHSGGRNPEPVDKARHRRKLDACRAAGVRLIQFYSDEWEDRPETCKSVIRNALGKNQRKLNGRDCQVVCVDSSVTRPFLEATHMSGATRAKAHFVLKHPEHGIVGAVTVRIPIQKKWGENMCELARMAFAFDTTVRGGAGKLLAAVEAWAKSEGYAGVLSYAELRFGEGGVYQKCGFTHMGETGLSYCYTDGAKRYDRFKYRAQPGKPEKQVVEEANVRAVWGCGNAVYVKKW
jgi:GNAT superfamily N-acetyltransferase